MLREWRKRIDDWTAALNILYEALTDSNVKLFSIAQKVLDVPVSKVCSVIYN